MNPDFLKYLEAIGLTKVLTHRAFAFHEFCTTICPEPLEFIFVSDVITQENLRVYESIWFFSKSYAMEAKEFATKDEYDFAIFQPPLHYFAFEKQDFDMKKATDQSRAKLSFAVSGGGLSGVTGTVKASKENCDYLWELFVKYFIAKTKTKE